jgi:hypothetical protein
MIMSKELAEAISKVGHSYRVSFTPPEDSHPSDFDINLFQLGEVTKVQGWVRKTSEGLGLRSRYSYQSVTAWKRAKDGVYPSAHQALLALRRILSKIKCEIGEEVFEGEEGA